MSRPYTKADPPHQHAVGALWLQVYEFDHKYVNYALDGRVSIIEKEEGGQRRISVELHEVDDLIAGLIRAKQQLNNAIAKRRVESSINQEGGHNG